MYHIYSVHSTESRRNVIKLFREVYFSPLKETVLQCQEVYCSRASNPIGCYVFTRIFLLALNVHEVSTQRIEFPRRQEEVRRSFDRTTGSEQKALSAIPLRSCPFFAPLSPVRLISLMLSPNWPTWKLRACKQRRGNPPSILCTRLLWKRNIRRNVVPLSFDFLAGKGGSECDCWLDYKAFWIVGR